MSENIKEDLKTMQDEIMKTTYSVMVKSIKFDIEYHQEKLDQAKAKMELMTKIKIQ
jgi:hypothetical protein